MPLLLMSLMPGKVTLDSLKWAAIAVVCGLLMIVGLSMMSRPTKLSYAVAAETEKAKVATLKAALAAEQAEKAEFAAALKARRHQEELQIVTNAELSARVEKLKAENAELTKPRSDDATPVFDPLDSWLLRNTKAGSADRRRP